MANLAQQEQATDEEQRVIDKFNLSFNLCSVIPVINTFILDKCCFAAKADYANLREAHRRAVWQRLA